MTPEQLKQFEEAVKSGDQVRLVTVGLQIAATNARAGNTDVANNIRTVIDSAKVKAQAEKEFKALRLQIASRLFTRDGVSQELALDWAESLILANEDRPIPSK